MTSRLREFQVHYVFPNDELEYEANVKATNVHDADRRFRDGLCGDEQNLVTITSIHARYGD